MEDFNEVDFHLIQNYIKEEYFIIQLNENIRVEHCISGKEKVFTEGHQIFLKLAFFFSSEFGRVNKGFINPLLTKLGFSYRELQQKGVSVLKGNNTVFFIPIVDEPIISEYAQCIDELKRFLVIDKRKPKILIKNFTKAVDSLCIEYGLTDDYMEDSNPTELVGHAQKNFPIQAAQAEKIKANLSDSMDDKLSKMVQAALDNLGKQHTVIKLDQDIVVNHSETNERRVFFRNEQIFLQLGFFFSTQFGRVSLEFILPLLKELKFNISDLYIEGWWYRPISRLSRSNYTIPPTYKGLMTDYQDSLDALKTGLKPNPYDAKDILENFNQEVNLMCIRQGIEVTDDYIYAGQFFIDTPQFTMGFTPHLKSDVEQPKEELEEEVKATLIPDIHIKDKSEMPDHPLRDEVNSDFIPPYIDTLADKVDSQSMLQEAQQKEGIPKDKSWFVAQFIESVNIVDLFPWYSAKKGESGCINKGDQMLCNKEFNYIQGIGKINKMDALRILRKVGNIQVKNSLHLKPKIYEQLLISEGVDEETMSLHRELQESKEHPVPSENPIMHMQVEDNFLTNQGAEELNALLEDLKKERAEFMSRAEFMDRVALSFVQGSCALFGENASNSIYEIDDLVDDAYIFARKMARKRDEIREEGKD